MRFMINTDFMFFKVIPTVSLGIKSSSWHERIKIQFYIVILHLIMVFKTIKVCLVFIICCLDFPYSKLDSSELDCFTTCKSEFICFSFNSHISHYKPLSINIIFIFIRIFVHLLFIVCIVFTLYNYWFMSEVLI